MSLTQVAASTVTRVPMRDGVIALSGYGILVAVRDGRLFVHDGYADERREVYVFRVDRPKRLVVLGPDGSVTLAALRWLRDVGCAFVHLEHNGEIVNVSAASLDDARLRRTQALLGFLPERVAIARDLLAAKIAGQISVLDSFGLAPAAGLSNELEMVQIAESIEGVMLAELRAAEAYWAAWRQVTVRFAGRKTVPDNWTRFVSRSSALTGRSRSAVDPINALLNYCYALLETETRIALLAKGLDPAFGLFHVDLPNRDSFASDVMEALRPQVDAFVLHLVAKRTFSVNDFAEQPDGACRFMPHIAHELIATMPSWARLAQPVVDRLAKTVAALAQNVEVPAAFIAGREAVVVNRRSIAKVSVVAALAVPPIARVAPRLAVKPSCRLCGARVVAKRVYCDPCLPAVREEVVGATAERFARAGPEALARMRKSGHDPTQTAEARAKRVRSMRKRMRANRDFVDDGTLATIDFDRDVLPGLQRVTIKRMSEATGLSPSHCSKIRSGRLRPHRSHFRALLALYQ